jgi:predicted ATPase
MTEAREQSAIGWEMKAGLPLARLWQASGRKDEAHTLLSSIYDKFDQGFDTPDLVAASEMLSKVERVQP